MQPGLLHALPIRTERLAPLGGEVFVLRKDVLDGVLINGHALFAVVILKAAQPVATPWEVVQVARGQLALELIVTRKAPIGRESQEVRLNAYSGTP